MSEDDFGRRPAALPEGAHRARPALARWTRATAAIACVVAGAVLVIRGLAAGESLWLWLGVGLLVLGTSGVFAAMWMFRRGL